MPEDNIIVNLNQIELLGPLMAGHILGAYYSALLLKKHSGVDITPEVEVETLKEVVRKWSDIQKIVNQIPTNKTTRGSSQDQ